jgi:hypothetical protein
MLENLLHTIGMVGIFRMFIYAIGEPHDMYNPRAILSVYSAFLAELRLMQLGIRDWPTILQEGKKEDLILSQELFDAWAVDRVRPIAGWINAFGFCPICTSFWFMAGAVWLWTGSFVWFGISLLLNKIVFKWT